MPVLAAFLREQPKVTATLITLDRVANLIEEGFDVALRIAQLPNSGWSRAGRRGAAAMVASPAYLARHGTPGEPDELRAHELIALRRHVRRRRVALCP